MPVQINADGMDWGQVADDVIPDPRVETRGVCKKQGWTLFAFVGVPFDIAESDITDSAGASLQI